MDVYLLQQKLLTAWRSLSLSSDSGSLKKEWNDIPAYITINNQLIEIKDIQIEDGKIILKY